MSSDTKSDVIPIQQDAIFAVMEEIMQSKAIHYNAEALAHYVQMRLATAKLGYIGPKPGGADTLTRNTIRTWVKAFKAKYDPER
jgi:hypothetical protein